MRPVVEVVVQPGGDGSAQAPARSGARPVAGHHEGDGREPAAGRARFGVREQRQRRVLKGDHAKRRGLVFRTEEVQIDGAQATASGGYFEAGLSASGNIYTVERQRDGSWLMTSDKMQWII
jgi:hypothetical protein